MIQGSVVLPYRGSTPYPRAHGIRAKAQISQRACDFVETASQRVLVIDHDGNVRRLLRLHLERHAFRVEEAADGALALRLLRRSRYEVILLDVALPRVDGLALCRAIRESGPNELTPVIIVSARGSEADKVRALEVGADDYLVKPFGVAELVARVKAAARRQQAFRTRQPSAETARLSTPQVTIDLQTRTAVVRGKGVALTRQEFDLLVCLIENRGRVFSRDALLRTVWRADEYVSERTVDTIVSRLRKKIERLPSDPSLIQTVWGVGYKFGE